MPASISVICTFLDAEQTLGATLESLRRQSLGEARFILVDDGSRDRSAAIATQFCTADSRFAFLTNPNPGRIRALNLAVRHADTEYVAILDADDIAHPMWLSDGLAAIRKAPEFAVIGFERLFIRDLAAPDWMATAALPEAKVTDITQSLARGNVIGHSGVLVRMARFIKVGGYDETLAYLEDYDLWIRMACSGGVLGLCNLVRVAKRYHEGQKFGHTPRLLLAAWRIQLRAVLAIDRSAGSFLSLAWFGVREFSRQPRRALAALASRR